MAELLPCRKIAARTINPASGHLASLYHVLNPCSGREVFFVLRVCLETFGLLRGLALKRESWKPGSPRSKSGSTTFGGVSTGESFGLSASQFSHL